MKAKEAFEMTVRRVFGDGTWGEIEGLYQAVLENQGKPCGQFGDDACTKELMLFLRKRMRELDLAPKQSVWLDKPDHFFEEKDRWLTPEYRRRFPISSKSEPEVRLNREYDVDGWDYQSMDVDRDAEWIAEHRKYGLTHYYYHQLDHYLTYLVGAIRRGIEHDGIKKGAIIKKDLHDSRDGSQRHPI